MQERVKPAGSANPPPEAVQANPANQKLGESPEGPGPRLMTASTLTGEPVVDAAGEKLGKIEEIMLDVPRGRIAYAVLSFGGVMGVGEKLFAVPWGALALDTEHKRFVLDMPKTRLEKAPGFDPNRWPSWADETFARSLHTHYDVTPYWE